MEPEKDLLFDEAKRSAELMLSGGGRQEIGCRERRGRETGSKASTANRAAFISHRTWGYMSQTGLKVQDQGRQQ